MTTLARRAFIGTGLAAPLIPHAADKAERKRRSLRRGDWTFEWTRDWGLDLLVMF